MQRSPHLEAHLYDINPELVVAYTAVQRDPQGLIELLATHRTQYMALDAEGRSAFYYSRRAHYNAQRGAFNYTAFSGAWVARAADLIFLNKTCYNGLFRVNAAGGFNVPFGRYANPEIFDRDNLLAVAELLGRAVIRCGSFEACRTVVDARTFVYFDPPYRPISPTSSFNAYAADRFGDDEQRRLASFFAELHASTEAKLMLSNSDPKNYDPDDTFFDDLYSSFTVHRVSATRMINSVAEKRGSVTEILVTNH
jgi:DNA adenine methylase